MISYCDPDSRPFTMCSFSNVFSVPHIVTQPGFPIAFARSFLLWSIGLTPESRREMKKKREIFIGALHYVRHVEQRGRLLRFIPCVAGQGDGCQQARNQVVSVAEAGSSIRKRVSSKKRLFFASQKRMMKIRRGIGNRLARQFPDTSSIFNHYLTRP